MFASAAAASSAHVSAGFCLRVPVAAITLLLRTASALCSFKDEGFKLVGQGEVDPNFKVRDQGLKPDDIVKAKTNLAKA